MLSFFLRAGDWRATRFVGDVCLVAVSSPASAASYLGMIARPASFGRDAVFFVCFLLLLLLTFLPSDFPKG